MKLRYQKNILQFQSSLLGMYCTIWDLKRRRMKKNYGRDKTLRSDFGCVSTQRHKRVSYVGFENCDFTSLSLRKIKAQGRFEPSQSCLLSKLPSASWNLKSYQSRHQGNHSSQWNFGGLVLQLYINLWGFSSVMAILLNYVSIKQVHQK